MDTTEEFLPRELWAIIAHHIYERSEFIKIYYLSIPIRREMDASIINTSNGSYFYNNMKHGRQLKIADNNIYANYRFGVLEGPYINVITKKRKKNIECFDFRHNVMRGFFLRYSIKSRSNVCNVMFNINEKKYIYAEILFSIDITELKTLTLKSLLQVIKQLLLGKYHRQDIGNPLYMVTKHTAGEYCLTIKITVEGKTVPTVNIRILEGDTSNSNRVITSIFNYINNYEVNVDDFVLPKILYDA